MQKGLINGLEIYTQIFLRRLTVNAGILRRRKENLQYIVFKYIEIKKKQDESDDVLSVYDERFSFLF